MARILVIDDDETFRALLLEMVTEIGHTAIGAPNGFEGLKLFRAAPADLILTDMMMPYSGLATIRILREEFPRLGIIAMSGGAEHRLDYARSLGAHAALPSPSARPNSPPRSPQCWRPIRRSRRIRADP